MRLMYWYALTPVVVVFGGLVFLTIPFLALAVLTIAALGALAGLAWAIVAVPYMLGHAISRRWQTDDQSVGGRDDAPSQPTFRGGQVFMSRSPIKDGAEVSD